MKAKVPKTVQRPCNPAPLLPCTSPPVISTLSHDSPTALANTVLLRSALHTLDSVPLRLLFPLPGILSPQSSHGWLTPFLNSLLMCCRHPPLSAASPRLPLLICLHCIHHHLPLFYCVIFALLPLRMSSLYPLSLLPSQMFVFFSGIYFKRAGLCLGP